RHRELHELVVEEGLAPLDRARHRDAVHAGEQELRQPLAQLEVGHALEEVGVAAPGTPLVPDALDRAQRAVVATAQEAALERTAEAERATPVGDAAVARVVERLAVTD